MDSPSAMRLKEADASRRLIGAFGRVRGADGQNASKKQTPLGV